MEKIRTIDSIPDPIKRASHETENAQKWMQIGDLIAWLTRISSVIVSSGHGVTISSIAYEDDDIMEITCSNGAVLHASPLLRDPRNVLYGFSFSHTNRDGEEKYENEVVMPDDIIENLPHSIPDEHGTYAFNLRDFIKHINEYHSF